MIGAESRARRAPLQFSRTLVRGSSQCSRDPQPNRLQLRRFENGGSMKKSYVAVVAVLIVVLIAVASIKPASAIQKDSAARLKSLEAEFMKAAAQKGSAGYMSYYAGDAVELPNGGNAIQGKDHIAQGMGFLDQGNKLTWTPEFADMAASGDLG